MLGAGTNVRSGEGRSIQMFTVTIQFPALFLFSRTWKNATVAVFPAALALADSALFATGANSLPHPETESVGAWKLMSPVSVELKRAAAEDLACSIVRRLAKKDSL